MGKGFVTFQRKLRGDTTPYRVVSGNHPVIENEEGFRCLLNLAWAPGSYISEIGSTTEDIMWALDSFRWSASGLTEEQQDDLLSFMEDDCPIPEFLGELLTRWEVMGSDNWEYTE